MEKYQAEKECSRIILEISIYSCINSGCICHSIASFFFIILVFACNCKQEEGRQGSVLQRTIVSVPTAMSRLRVFKTGANGKKRSYSCNHCFSQIVICGECGEMFRRLHWNNREVESIIWRYISRLESTGLECHARTINELVLQNVVVKAINQML